MLPVYIKNHSDASNAHDADDAVFNFLNMFKSSYSSIVASVLTRFFSIYTSMTIKDSYINIDFNIFQKKPNFKNCSQSS